MGKDSNVTPDITLTTSMSIYM